MLDFVTEECAVLSYSKCFQLSRIDTEGGVVDFSNLFFQVLPGNDEAF